MNKISWLVLLSFFTLVGCSSQSSKNAQSTTTSKTQQYEESYGAYHDSQALSFDNEIKNLEQIDTVYFDFNQYDIGAQYAYLLDKHAQFLNSSLSRVVTIEGHADERGTSEYNIALGERRANAVKDYLQSRGVSARQVNVVSFGKEKPAVLGHTEAVYEKNRRAVLVY